MSTSTMGLLAGHGLSALPSVTVDSYNLDVRDGRRILNHQLKRADFFETLAKLAKDTSDWPFADREPTAIKRKELDEALAKGSGPVVEVIEAAIHAFGTTMAEVIRHFLKTKEWHGVERIVIGGGFRKGRIGKSCIARAGQVLLAEGVKVELVPTHYHSDDAGLVGGAHLLPSWMLKGHDAMLCADIGGTNLRVGLVALKLAKAADLSKASVIERDLWRHAEDDPKRTETVVTLASMARRLIKEAHRRGCELAPAIAVGCPGVIDEDGSILRGAVNLPGGNWESERFNLVAAITKQIGRIGDNPTSVLLHNDAVVQGLSQRPWMDDVRRWGVMTIGTGLGNASFTNREE